MSTFKYFEEEGSVSESEANRSQFMFDQDWNAIFDVFRSTKSII